MKKLLLFISVFVLMFTLSACDGSTDLLSSITDAEDSIVEVEADITALQTAVTAAEASVTMTETDIADLTELVTTIKADVVTIQTEIAALEEESGDNANAITALQNTLIPTLKSITALEKRIEALEQMSITDWQYKLADKIVLMYSNDVHGRVNDDSYAGSIGYATIKNMVDSVRSNYDYTYLVSAGDMFHGTTFATLENGESFVEVMNAVGYDLMVPGNHDFDYGQEQLLVLEGMANFPLISSNIQYTALNPNFVADDGDDETEEVNDMFDTYKIETFGDYTVGFFGLTTPDTVTMTHPDNVTAIDFLDPIAQAQYMVDMLQEMEVDFIVCLGHIGLDVNDSITSESIALAVDGIDVFVDGHSHTYLPNGKMVNDTMIVQTGEYNKNFGVLELVIEDGMIIEYNNLLIDADEAAMLDLGASEEVQAVIDAISVDQEAILNIVVGQTAVELDGLRDNVRTSETNLAQIITDSMIVVSGADVAITNGGGIRASIAAGDVTRGDVITVLPFGNIIVTVDLTGQELLDTLEYGTKSYPGSSGKFPHVAGITYTIDLNNAEGFRVIDVMVNGADLNLNTIYSVATNDFMAAGGDGYEILGDATVTAEYSGLHEALESMFTVGTDIVIPVDVRVTVIEEVVLPAQTLFFSEYAEADGGSCKYVEIYNASDAAVDLSNYSVIKGGNGKLFWMSSDIEMLTGTLDAGAVLVIGNSACVNVSDQAQDVLVSDPLFPTSGITWVESTVVGYINGDDALGLFYMGALVDVIGTNGTDPGSNWPVGLGNLTDGTTANTILIRGTAVSTGEADWAVGAMQWIVVADDRDYSSVGTHTYTPAS